MGWTSKVWPRCRLPDAHESGRTAICNSQALTLDTAHVSIVAPDMSLWAARAGAGAGPESATKKLQRKEVPRKKLKKTGERTSAFRGIHNLYIQTNHPRHAVLCCAARTTPRDPLRSQLLYPEGEIPKWPMHVETASCGNPRVAACPGSSRP